MERHPIVICGGSLAGAAAAIRLRQLGLPVLVLEKSCFPRKKLCGEFLGPDSFAILKQLGLLETVLQAGYGPVEAAIFHTRQGRRFTVPMRWINPRYPYGLGISRETLDWLLLQAAIAMGAEVRPGWRVLPTLQPAKDGVVLQAVNPQENNEAVTFEAAILIDATGRHGGLRLGAVDPPQARPCRDKIGVKAQVRLASGRLNDKLLRMFFFPGGYGGIQPVNEEIVNVCLLGPAENAGLVRQDVMRYFDNTLCQNPAAATLLLDAQPVEAPQTTAHINFRSKPAPTDDLLRVGDAMLTVDPFTGSGMAIALQTGLLAAETIAQGFQEEQPYSWMVQRYLKAYDQRLSLRLKLLNRFRPFLFADALHDVSLPLIRPLLPAMARVFR